MVILSGNQQDRYAGVGAIISPKLRPHLNDVLQVNPRIIHLSFKQKGGNIHVLGAYGPHSGLDSKNSGNHSGNKLRKGEVKFHNQSQST